MNAPKVHFVGIGGIGMSALAQLALHNGTAVSGSDSAASPITKLLQKLGINIVIGHTVEHVPSDAQFVVYSDAVSAENPERQQARRLGIEELSYFEALGRFTQGKFVIAVAGTHGKTTTTAMLAKILWDVGRKPTSIVGSIVRDFGSNFIAGDQSLFVVEACEYRDHFLHLRPNILVITNIEWDHNDWFSNLSAVQATFRKAVQGLPPDGVLVTDATNQTIAEMLDGLPVRIVDYTSESVGQLRLIGEFNRSNARAAKAAARVLVKDLNVGSADAALTNFTGTWRRFESHGMTQSGALVFDDYAHHPTAVRKTIEAARARYGDRRILVAFQPHLYSRTQEFLESFAEALSQADLVYVSPIYAARETPILGVRHDVLVDRINQTRSCARAFSQLSDVQKQIERETGPGDLIITMGAGDIYTIADRLGNLHP